MQTQTVDTFVQDLRVYIKKEDEKPLLGPSFYTSVIDGTLSREQLKKWVLNLFYVTGQHIRAFGGIFMNTGLSPMDELLSSTIADRRFNMFLLGAFAAVALSLAAVGIYGLIAYSVAQRTRELGIRMALGAAPRDVQLLVIRQGATLAAAGIVVGGVGAIAATRWMRSMLFQVDPLDPLTFAAVGVALAAVAIGATWAPALRAARVSPVTAMRND